MEIVLKRQQRNEISTIGKFSIVGSPFSCVTLEGKDRGLLKSMPLEQINAIKVKNHTAIPAGRYQVVIDFSTRFNRPMPLLVNVPGYAGIRIHPGNTDADTDGCLLLGTAQVNADFIANSREAFAAFYPLLKQAIDKGGPAFITIQ